MEEARGEEKDQERRLCSVSIEGKPASEDDVSWECVNAVDGPLAVHDCEYVAMWHPLGGES